MLYEGDLLFKPIGIPKQVSWATRAALQAARKEGDLENVLDVD